MTDFTKKQRLYGAIIPELRAIVEPQAADTDSWETIVKRAERHDSALHQAKLLGGKGGLTFRKEPKRASQGTSGDEGNDARGHRSGSRQAGQRPRKVFTKLTPEVRAQLLKEGKCLYCRETGHVVAQCPKKPKTDRTSVWKRPAASTAATTAATAAATTDTEETSGSDTSSFSTTS